MKKKYKYKALEAARKHAKSQVVVPDSSQTVDELCEEHNISKTKNVSKSLFEFPEDFKIEITESQAFAMMEKFKMASQKVQEIKKTARDYDDQILILKPGNKKRSWQKIQQKIQNPRYYIVRETIGSWDSVATYLTISIEGQVTKSNSELEDAIRDKKSKQKKKEREERAMREKELAELKRLRAKYEDA